MTADIVNAFLGAGAAGAMTLIVMIVFWGLAQFIKAFDWKTGPIDLILKIVRWFFYLAIIAIFLTFFSGLITDTKFLNNVGRVFKYWQAWMEDGPPDIDGPSNGSPQHRDCTNTPNSKIKVTLFYTRSRDPSKLYQSLKDECYDAAEPKKWDWRVSLKPDNFGTTFIFVSGRYMPGNLKVQDRVRDNIATLAYDHLRPRFRVDHPSDPDKPGIVRGGVGEAFGPDDVRIILY